jgi:hypothetical protein
MEQVKVVNAKAADVYRYMNFDKIAAFFEWTDPIFVGGHWTPQVIQMAGGSHPLNSPK